MNALIIFWMACILSATEFAFPHKQELHVLVLAYQCIVQKHKESKR